MTRPVAAVAATDLPGLTAALASALGGGPAVLPLPAGAAGPQPPLADEEAAAAVLVATSGSTGEPKVVMLTAEAVLASAAATHERLGGAGRWVLALPATHVAGLQVLVRSLLAGTGPAAVEPGGAGFADRLAEASRVGASAWDGPTYTSLVPTQLHRLLAAGSAGRSALRAFDAVLLGGAAAPPRLVEEAREVGIRLVLTYGMSETAGGCVYDGRPLDRVDVSLVDRSPDGSGTVTIAGPVLFSGYRGRPDLTAEALVDGRLVTRDRGRWRHDGALEVLGRLDDVVVSGGENVSLAAVERTLSEHPSVEAAVAVGVEDLQWGARVEVVVVPSAGARVAEDVLRAWVRDRLGRAAVPRAVHRVDAIPLTGLGKPDRAAVRTLVARAGPPGPG